MAGVTDAFNADVVGVGHHGAMDNTHHGFDYIEFGVVDLPATRAFYEAAFGWVFTEYGPHYAGIRAIDGDGEVGGLTTTRAPGGNGLLVLLYSDDLNGSVTAVEHAGGTVTSGPYGFPGGRRFTFTDPSGNELGVWSES